MLFTLILAPAQACDPVTLANEAPAASSAVSNEQIANQAMNIKKVSAEVLKHPLYGPEFLKWLEIARWMESEEGRLVSERYIKTINDLTLNKARLIAQEYQAKVKPELYFQPNQTVAPISAAAKAEILSTTSSLENDLELDLVDLFGKVIQQVAFEREISSRCPPHYASVLLKNFYAQPVDWVRPQNIIAYHHQVSNALQGNRKSELAKDSLVSFFKVRQS